MRQSAQPYGVAPSQVEKHGLTRALEDDVKMVNDYCTTMLAPGQQRRSSLAGDTLQHHILGVGWLVCEVQARHKVVEQPASEHSNADVRCLHRCRRLLKCSDTPPAPLLLPLPAGNARRQCGCQVPIRGSLCIKWDGAGLDRLEPVAPVVACA